MTEDQVKAVFLLSGLETTQFYKIENEYWPKAYVKEREETPWWLVKTEFGLIKIGWRKRVINIDWTDTGLIIDANANRDYEFHKLPITRDDVTMWEHGVHAYGYGRAADYLNELKLRLKQFKYANSEEGKADLARRKEKALSRE